MTFDSYMQRISSPALRAVAAHWDEARGSRVMPAWEDLRPARIAAHLSRVWAVRFDRRTREFTMRLAGDRIVRGFGRSFRGVPMKDLYPPECFQKIYDHALRLMDVPSLSYCQGNLFRFSGYFGVGERISLPLSPDGVATDGYLGASDYRFDLPQNSDGRVELFVDGEQYFPLHDFHREAA